MKRSQYRREATVGLGEATSTLKILSDHNYYRLHFSTIKSILEVRRINTSQPSSNLFFDYTEKKEVGHVLHDFMTQFRVRFYLVTLETQLIHFKVTIFKFIFY